MSIKRYEYEKQVFIRDYLIRALGESENIVSVAAKKAGINKSHFYRLLKIYAPDLKTDCNHKQWAESFRNTWENKVGNAAWRELSDGL